MDLIGKLELEGAAKVYPEEIGRVEDLAAKLTEVYGPDVVNFVTTLLTPFRFSGGDQMKLVVNFEKLYDQGLITILPIDIEEFPHAPTAFYLPTKLGRTNIENPCHIGLKSIEELRGKLLLRPYVPGHMKYFGQSAAFGFIDKNDDLILLTGFTYNGFENREGLSLIETSILALAYSFHQMSFSMKRRDTFGDHNPIYEERLAESIFNMARLTSFHATGIFEE